jgi:hypothetical protein
MLLEVSITLQESSIMLLELSIMLLENIYSTGSLTIVTYNCQNIFIVQTNGQSDDIQQYDAQQYDIEHNAIQHKNKWWSGASSKRSFV